MAASRSSGKVLEPVTGSCGCFVTDTPRTEVVGDGAGGGGGGATVAGATWIGGGVGLGVGVGVGLGVGQGRGCTNPPAVPVRPKSWPELSAERLLSLGIS